MGNFQYLLPLVLSSNIDSVEVGSGRLCNHHLLPLTLKTRKCAPSRRRVDIGHHGSQNMLSLRIHISNSPRPQLHHGLRSRKSLRLRYDFRVIKGFTGSCDVKTKDVEIKGAIMAAFLRLLFCYFGVIVKVRSTFHYSVSPRKKKWIVLSFSGPVDVSVSFVDCIALKCLLPIM